MPGTLQFSRDGIAHLLSDQLLSVPVYQREYSWRLDEDNQVGDFWEDLAAAFAGGFDNEYFLGTIVLTSDDGSERLRVIDGQQRLATASILVAAIRDALRAHGQDADADIVQRDYLAAAQLGQPDEIARLVLNEDDDGFYQQRIVGGDEDAAPQRPSHDRIAEAHSHLTARVEEFIVDRGAQWYVELTKFVTFLSEKVAVVTVTVPTEADAYTIFETLNDRGAGLTVADLLKNFLFSVSGAHLNTVRNSWIRATGALQTTAGDNEFATFLRHYWSSRSGVTRERDLYKGFKAALTSSAKAREFARDLEKGAKLYSAILSPANEFWNDYSDTDREAVSVLVKFDLAPNKELLLAILDKWPKAKIKQALRVLVSWSVRLLVEGTINNSAVETAYCGAAVKVRSGAITTRQQLFAEVQGQVPGDGEFKQKFAITRVSKSALARYYLSAIEGHRAGVQQPELVPNQNTDAVNLEHVLPKNSKTPEWPHLSADLRRVLPERLGNLCLLPKGPNGRLGSAAFNVKKPVLGASQLALTREIGQAAGWGPTEIDQRQAKLAEDAVAVWPLLP